MREDREHGLVIVEEFDARFSLSLPEVVDVADRLMCARHMNLARVHRVERAGGSVHVVGEYIEGETYADLVRLSNGALALEARLRIIVDVLGGVAALHAEQAVHGAIDAGSIVTGLDGTTRVIRACQGPCVRVAVLEHERASLAPEVARGERPTESADVYGVGALLWEALARRALTVAEREMDVPAPALGPDQQWATPLAELAARALRVDPSGRPASASEMAALVRTCARTRLGTHDAIADAVREFGTDHLLERRRRIDRSSSGTVRAAEAVTAFDVATTPKGRQTLPIGDDWATEAPTLRRRATSAQEIDVDVELSKEPPEVVSASGDFTPLVEALEPAAEPEDDVSHGLAALELASDELASDEPLAERIPSMIELAREPQKPRPVRRGSRRVWAVAIAVLTVCVAVVVVAFSLHAPRETATAPLDSVPMRAPALGGTVAPPASIAPEATATPAPTTSTAPSASALPKGAPSKRPPKPLRAPGQYDPASI